MDINPGNLQLHDSDIVALDEAKRRLDGYAQSQNWRVDLEDHRLRTIDEIAKAGFRADVRVFEARIEGQPGYVFECQLEERLKGEFDPDQQVHEAVHDVAGLGESGWLKSDDEIKKHEGRRHSHSGGHSH